MAISAQQTRTVTEEQINQIVQGMTGSFAPYRIGHPTHPLGFTKDLPQLLGEATVLRPAAFAAAGRSARRRRWLSPWPGLWSRFMCGIEQIAVRVSTNLKALADR